MTRATVSEIQNNFGKFLEMVQNGQEVVILKNGKEVARLTSRISTSTKNSTKSFGNLTDSLIGVLSLDPDEKVLREERRRKYEDIG